MRKAFDYLFEKKDHIIRKLPNLSQQEKDIVIKYFEEHPEAESLLDWNKAKSFTYQDFLPILNRVTNSQKIRTMKSSGMQSLKKGLDYKVVYDSGDGVIGYCPLTYEASKLLASPYVGGGPNADWCIAYQRTDQYWNEYRDENIAFCIFVEYEQSPQRRPFGKYAYVLYPESRRSGERDELYNMEDTKIRASILIEEGVITDEDLEEVRDSLREIQEERAPFINVRIEARMFSGKNQITIDYEISKGDEGTTLSYKLRYTRMGQGVGYPGLFEHGLQFMKNDPEEIPFDLLDGNGVIIMEDTPLSEIESQAESRYDSTDDGPELDYSQTYRFVSQAVSNIQALTGNTPIDYIILPLDMTEDLKESILEECLGLLSEKTYTSYELGIFELVPSRTFHYRDNPQTIHDIADGISSKKQQNRGQYALDF